MSLRPGSVNFSDKWGDLRTTIDAVVKLKPVKRMTWNDNISDIYALCVAFPTSYAETLYEQTKSLLEVNVTEFANELLGLDSRPMLLRYHHYWSLYSQGAHYLDNLFSYFNRVHLMKYKPADSLDYHVPGIVLPSLNTVDPSAPVKIRNMAFRVWREKMADVIKEKLLSSILAEIARDRNGLDSNLSMVQAVLASFVTMEEYNTDSELEYYQKFFESPFLKSTGQYYQLKAAELISELSYSEYLEKAVQLLKNAKRRGDKFLHPSTSIKFIRECEARLVTDQMDYLLSCVPEMIHAERLTDLTNLYTLLSDIPNALEPVRNEFKKRVMDQGTSEMKTLLLSKDTIDVQEFINVILCTHGKYKNVVMTVFNEDKLFHRALDDGCKGFVNKVFGNQSHSQSPRLLARYCDQLLKKGSKTVSESELEEKLDNAIIVFQYIEDKDTFQKFYSRMLSRRLIHSNFLSMETEESMIQKLKYVCGYEYTARLQRMIVDMTVSNTLVTEFNDHLKINKDYLSIGFSTLVLQSGSWQLTQSPCPELNVPQEFLTVMQKFESFYNKKYCGRCLSWLHHLSIGELKILYTKRPYFITFTTFQIVVLLAFESKDTLSLNLLQHWTQLDIKELKATLQSLVDTKILLSSEKSPVPVTGSDHDESSDDAYYTLNTNYTNKRTKFKLSSFVQRETQQEIDHTHKVVLEDRKMFIQAAIVRVMKHRKVLKHNQLIEETISLIKSRFNPNIGLIKKCIEALIEKQYLERNPDTRDTYKYMA